jgi:hypothetical protein
MFCTDDVILCGCASPSLLMVCAQLFRGQSDNRDACAAADCDDGYKDGLHPMAAEKKINGGS